MLSGIGAADELRAAGIAPVHELPGVGRNLADHPVIINEFDLKGDAGLTRHLRADRAALRRWRWYSRKRRAVRLHRHARQRLRALDRRARPARHADDVPATERRRAAVAAGPPAQAGLAAVGAHRLPAAEVARLGPPALGRSARCRRASSSTCSPSPGTWTAWSARCSFSRQIYAQSPLSELIARENLPGERVQERCRPCRTRPPPRRPPRASRRHVPHGDGRRGGGRRRAARARASTACAWPTPRSCPRLPRGNPNLAVHDDRREGGGPDPWADAAGRNTRSRPQSARAQRVAQVSETCFLTPEVAARGRHDRRRASTDQDRVMPATMPGDGPPPCAKPRRPCRARGGHAHPASPERDPRRLRSARARPSSA